MNINQPSKDDKIITIKTNMGEIKVAMLAQAAPKTVENFLTHATNGYYDGLIFHRVINEFMIQGGDPTGTGMGGESIWGKSFEDEYCENAVNLRGALSMANSGPNTNGSQFFIVHSKGCDPRMLAQMEAGGMAKEVIDAYKEQGGTPWLDGKHTVFGQVVEGMDVIDKIATVKVDRSDKPLEDVFIESIQV